MERRQIMRKGYVTLHLKVPYHYDEDGMRKYEYDGLSSISVNTVKPILCAGFDVDSDEDGQSMVNCTCQQCKESYKTEVNYETTVSLSYDSNHAVDSYGLTEDYDREPPKTGDESWDEKIIRKSNEKNV